MKNGLILTLVALAAGLAVALSATPGQAASPDTASNGAKSPGLQIAQLQSPDIGEDDDPAQQKKAAAEAIEHFKATIDVLNSNVSQAYGGAPPFPKVELVEPGTAKITPSKAWMAQPAAHYHNAMTLYRMWKTANQFRPVTLMIADEKGGDYITIKDTPKGLEYRARQY